MTANAWKFYEIARERIADGTYDLDDDTFTIALFLSTSDAATLTGGTNDDLADLTNQHANNNGYTTGGINVAATWVRSGETITFDTANAVWTADGGSIIARFAVMYDNTHAQNGLLCMSLLDNNPLDVTATDGNTLTVQINASGVFTLTGAGA